MTLDGRVTGNEAQTAYSNYNRDPATEIDLMLQAKAQFTKNLFVSPGVLQLKSITPGHIVIKGQSSSLFLCVDSRGHLRGQVSSEMNSSSLKYQLHPHDAFVFFSLSE